jgi:hypothetical protein
MVIFAIIRNLMIKFYIIQELKSLIFNKNVSTNKTT